MGVCVCVGGGNATGKVPEIQPFHHRQPELLGTIIHLDTHTHTHTHTH